MSKPIHEIVVEADYDFDVDDKRGRRIGLRILHYHHPRASGGARYGFEPVILRDGNPWGITQFPLYFDTPAERDAAAEAYVERTRGRLMRKNTK